jgi:hypothetical protein
MRCGIRAVEADGHSGHAAFTEFPNLVLRKKTRGAGTDVGVQSQRHTAPEEGKNIRTLQRVATGKNHQGNAKLPDGIEETVGFLR